MSFQAVILKEVLIKFHKVKMYKIKFVMLNKQALINFTTNNISIVCCKKWKINNIIKGLNSRKKLKNFNKRMMLLFLGITWMILKLKAVFPK